MQHVFHIISHFDVGGAERVAVNIAKSDTPDIKYHVVEVIRGRSQFTKIFINELHDSDIYYHRAWLPEIHFHYIFERVAAMLFPLWFVFLFLRYRPSVIHAHTEVPDMALFSFLSLFPWLCRRCRIVRTVHSTKLWTGLTRTGRAVERMYRRHGVSVAISKSVQESYYRVYGIRPRIINNGVGQAVQRPYAGIVAGRRNILFAGRLEPEKGIDVLIRVVKMLENNTDIHFHIVGDGSLRGMVETELSGCGNVTLSPAIYGLSSYMSSFDCLFMPSRFEGLGLVSIEASMAGLPVVASNCMGLSDTLPGDWPFLAHPDDACRFCEILSSVLPSSDREDLIHSAQRFVTCNFSIKVMQQAYEKVYLSKI